MNSPNSVFSLFLSNYQYHYHINDLLKGNNTLNATFRLLVYSDSLSKLNKKISSVKKI